MNRIITISREFGSGGRELGRRLSERLGFAYYDQEIIQEIARRTSLSEQYVQAIVEHRPAFSYPIHIGHSFYPASNQPFEQTVSIYQEQMEIIQEMAAKSSCVIVGRCADYILRDRQPFRVLVYANMESKLKRCREKAPAEEHLTDRELKQKIQSVDRRRAKFYELYTGSPWRNMENFDVCVNTTHVSVRAWVPFLASLVQSEK